VNTILSQKDELSELKAACTAENLLQLDFDRLRAALKEQLELLAAHEASIAELEHLRRDYIERITAMAKAIAAVSRRKESLSDVAEYIMSLSTLPAQQLIEHYRLTRARFREAFPTSFGRLTRQDR
jgi:hypothetical protein